MEFEPKNNYTMAFHAVETGVVVEPFAHARSRYKNFKIYETIKDYDNFEEITKKYVGKKYDFKCTIWNGILLVLFGLFRLEFLYSLAIRDKSRFSCADLTSFIFKDLEFKGSEYLDPDLVYPGLLEHYCSMSGDLRYVFKY
jgi:hypothetical protein